MKLSLIFNFRNEESNLNQLVIRSKKALDDSKLFNANEYEFIFVNDDSTDNSLNILIEFKSRGFPIKIINMSRNFGRSACLYAGFTIATGDSVVYMDSDLQDPPELIPTLYMKFLEGYDVVHTIRSNRLGESRTKMFITEIAYKIIFLLSFHQIKSNVGDFKLISKKIVSHILEIKDLDPYVRGMFVWVGFKQVYVNYTREPRLYGVTNFSIFGLGPITEFIRGIISISNLPLYLPFFLGVFSILFSFCIIIYALIVKFFGSAAPGSTSILIAISIFCGLILCSLGFIGVYVAKIYLQVKGYPRYVIKNIIN